MKRKWSLRLGAAVLCAVLLGSCGSTAAAPAESTAPADPLTGQQLLYPEQRAAAVVIENTTDSTTQWGIGSASVVLEAMTESGSSTELCLVYPALSAMPVVGPVTRGQDLYWRLLSGQQVLPIQCGSSAYAKRYLEYYNLRAVDAQEVGRNAFVSTGYSWDNTPLWRTSGKAVAAVLDSLSISTAVNQNTTSGSESETAGVLPTLLPQRDTGHLPDANAADAVKATVNFQSGGATGFVYDDALAAYGMLHADGTPQLDANTGTQAAFDNLLILYSGSSLRDDGRTLDYDLSMGGGKIRKGLGLVLGLAQQGSGVEGTHEQDAALFVQLAMLLGHGEILSDHPLGGNAAKADHDLWLQQAELLPQPGHTGFALSRLGVTVLRRAALDDVCNIAVLRAVKVDGKQIFVQQLAAAPHKGQTLLVLALAGALAHKQHLSVRHALPEHHVRPGGAQLAPGAGKAFGL
jgi:hypothetical protein